MPPKYILTPSTLFSSPSAKRWMRHAGKRYRVFVDESFFMFWDHGMSAQGGYFCHGAVAVPHNQYDTLAWNLRPVLDQYRRAADGASEIKSTQFARLPIDQRRNMAAEIAGELQRRGGFVAAFYTPVRAYVLEKVRTNLLFEKQTSVPIEHGDLFRAAAKSILSSFMPPGKSVLITELLLKAVGCTATTLASLRCPYEFTYDPREPKEDRTVRAGVERYLSLVSEAKGRGLDEAWNTDIGDLLIGVRHDRASHEEIGLQLADLVAGEAVRFFRSNPDLMEFQANRWIVTQASVESVSTLIPVEDLLLKNGTWYGMPEFLRAVFHKPDPQERTVFDLFTPVLASGGLTCYSSWGQPRQLLPYMEGIWDQID